MRLWCDAYVAVFATAPTTSPDAPTTSLGVASTAVRAFDLVFPEPKRGQPKFTGNAPPDDGI
jgi:hypothetical protein